MQDSVVQSAESRRGADGAALSPWRVDRGALSEAGGTGRESLLAGGQSSGRAAVLQLCSRAKARKPGAHASPLRRTSPRERLGHFGASAPLYGSPGSARGSVSPPPPAHHTFGSSAVVSSPQVAMDHEEGRNGGAGEILKMDKKR